MRDDLHISRTHSAQGAGYVMLCNIFCRGFKFPVRYANTSLAAKGPLAHRLQHCTACKIQNGQYGAPKWQTGSGKVSTPRFFGHFKQLSLNKFFDPCTPSMRKVEDEEEQRKERK